jgi:hypothetical protein
MNENDRNFLTCVPGLSVVPELPGQKIYRMTRLFESAVMRVVPKKIRNSGDGVRSHSGLGKVDTEWRGSKFVECAYVERTKESGI